MRRRWTVLLVLVPLIPLGPAPAAAEDTAPGWVDVCGPSGSGRARCLSRVSTTPGTGSVNATAGPAGFSPAQIKSIYGFPTSPTAGQGETIAIVTAFDAPTVERDLAVFSKQFGLPSCTTKNGCFKKVDEVGGTSYPPVDPGWALEAAIDTQWAHAIAPGAKILLIEADTNNFGDLLHAFQYATNHAEYSSNSWGAAEFPDQTIFDLLFVAPGVSDFFGSGDTGAPGIWPASSPEVIAVGGTSLTPAKSGVHELGWSGSGGGCSQYYAANPVQTAFSQYPATCAGQRAFPDVSFLADPATGVALYISTPFQGAVGWVVAGGTSLSAPIVAARAAVSHTVVDAAQVYGTGITFRDITQGNNGFPCLPGYDLVTGRGSWIG